MDDNYIWTAGGSDLNYGAYTLPWAVGKVLATEAKALWRFDLSGLPSGSTVSAATIGFTVDSIGADSGVNIRIWALKIANGDWVEGTGTGQANAGESCWNDHTYENQVEWAGSAGLSTSGTDYVGANAGTTDATSTGAKTITVNATGRADIEDHMGIDGVEFLVWTDDALSNNEYSGIETGESTTAADRPYLEITYEIPYAQPVVIRR